MEEKPPPQADRDVPRSRTPRAAFSTPDQPAPPVKPAERAPRRASKPAPPVTFQPPAGDSGEEQPRSRPAARKAQPQRPAKAAPDVQPNGSEPAADAPPAKAAPSRRTTSSRSAEATTPAKASPGPRAARRKAAAAAAQPAPEAAEPPARKAARKTARPAAAKAQQLPEQQVAASTGTGPVAEVQGEPPAAIPAAAETERVSLPEETPAPAAPPVDIVAPTTEAAANPPARRTEAWAKLVADPGHAPELLALAAVQTIGPRAKDWAHRHRDTYPNATDAGLARLATKQFTRFGTVAGVFGAVAGSYAPIALLGSSALAHAELVLHLAAAYGLDPTDERRAAELLVLTRVHPTTADAETALTAARQPAYDDGGITGAAWRFGRMAAIQAGGWAALRVVNRLFPGASLLVATTVSRNAVAALGTRATRFYSQSSQDAGSRV
jgi:hypothetical protein